MVENDFHKISTEFRNIVGVVATAEITEDGAARSAAIIVELEDKIYRKTTKPVDLFRAVLATSQLIERWSQLRQHLVSGSISSINDMQTFKNVQEKFAKGNLPIEEIQRLTEVMYVASPGLGANKAMDVLRKLQAMYTDISLQQPQR
jgi:hypothetical protein